MLTNNQVQHIMYTNREEHSLQNKTWKDWAIHNLIIKITNVMRNNLDIDPVYKKHVNSFKLLNTEEERALVFKLKSGSQKAKIKFYNSNLRLVLWVASRYKAFIKSDKILEFMDLVQSGNAGLMTAVEKFDLERETKFSTYATWWIRQAIGRFLADNGSTIRKPVHMVESISKYKKTVKMLETSGKEDTDVEIIAGHMGATVEDVLFIEETLSQTVSSIDKKIDSEEGKKSITDILPMKGVLSVDDSINWRLITVDLLQEMYQLLSLKEFEIIRMYYGLGNGVKYTFGKIGKKYGVTFERIRQIMSDAFAKLRGSDVIAQLIKESFNKTIPLSLDRVESDFKIKKTLMSSDMVTNFLDVVQKNISEYIPQVSFRGGQEFMYRAIVDNVKNGITSMYIEGPAGIGMTFIQALVADAILATKKGQVLLLTSRIDAFNYISSEYKRFAPSRTVSLYGGKNKDLSGDVVIMNYDSYRNMDSKVLFAFGTVLLDDAYRGLGKETSKKLFHQKKVSILIGFTPATNSVESKRLQALLGNLAYKISIRESIESGMLCAVQLIMASVDISIEKKEKSEPLSKYNERISSLITRQGGNIAAARLFKDLFKPRNLRGVMFALTISQGENLVDVLKEHDISAFLVSSKMSFIRRQELLCSFSKHEFDVLVGVDLLKEAINDNGISVSMFVYPTESKIDIIKGNGSILRLDEDNPDKLAYIVMLNFIHSDKQKFYHELVDNLAFVRPRKFSFGGKKDDHFSYDKVLAVDFKNIDMNQVDTEIQGIEIDNADVVHDTDLPKEDSMEEGEGYDIISKKEINSATVQLPSIVDVSVTHKELSKISKENNFNNYLDNLSEDKRFKLFSKRFAKHNINSLNELMHYGAQNFQSTSFGRFGIGVDFAGLILGKKVKKIDALVLVAISKKLKWRTNSTDRILIEVNN